VVTTPIDHGTSEADHEATSEADRKITSDGAGSKTTSNGSRRSDLPRLVIRKNPYRQESEE